MKAIGYLAAFATLAAFGSGALAGHLPPKVESVVGPLPTASVELESVGAPAASIDAGPIDAGAPIDAGSPTATVTPDGKVILNRATEEDLRRLPGVGPTKAKAILDLRTKLGKFKRPEDLMRIRGIGRRSMARLRPLVVVDG